MASKIDISALTLNAEEASEIGKLIIEKEFVNGVLAQNHEIYTGIHHKQQIPFASKLSDSLKKSTGCTPNAGGATAFTEKFWDPEKMDSRFEHCSDDLNKLLKIFKKAQKVNPDFYNKLGSEEINLLGSLVGMMLRETLPVKVWFSDKAADDIVGGGVFTNGTDVDLYNVFDGLFKKLFAMIPDSSDYYVEISENSEASYAAQALAADKAYDTLLAMRDAADERLVEDPDAKFYLTRTMADNYRNTLRNKTLSAGFIEVTENGKTTLMFDGIPIETMYVWDRTIKGVQDNGTTWNLPHRALLTTPGNIPVGTISESDFETLDSFYDQYRKSNIVDVALSLDAQALEDYMTVFAY